MDAERLNGTRITNHVVMFSGGLGSWATASRVIQRHGTASVTLLFADTLAEDPDLYRFLKETASQLGLPITRVVDGRTPWQVFRDSRHIGNTRIAPCSHLLKQAPCRQWMELNTNPAETMIYVGIDWSEIHRLAGVQRKWAPWSVAAPLCEPPYISKHAVADELAVVGIDPPRLYGLGFPHNNCGGACVKAGQAQWRRLLYVDPERYAAEEASENSLREYLDKDVAILRDRSGGTTKPLTLTVLRERSPELIDRDDWGGCGCFAESDEGVS